MFDLCAWIENQNAYAVEMARLHKMNNETWREINVTD